MFSSFMSIRVSILLDPVLPPSFQSLLHTRLLQCRHAKHRVTVRDKKLSDPMLYYCLHPAPPDTPLQLRLLTISKRLSNQILRIFSVPMSVLRQYGCACAQCAHPAPVL